MATIKSYDAIPLAKDISLNMPALTCRIEPSQLTCLVGPHRAQLRAYLQMLAGIFKPLSGGVEVAATRVNDLDRAAWIALRHKVGYLSGVAPLLSSQHGLMNVMLPALYHGGCSFQETAGKARLLLTEIDCQFDVTMIPALLNGFQRSQLAMARALILQPEVLIWDVPFFDLGAREREKMAELLAKYQKNRAVCMIGGLQYPHFLEQYVHQIIYISEDKIVKFEGWNSFLQTTDDDVKELLSTL